MSNEFENASIEPGKTTGGLTRQRRGPTSQPEVTSQLEAPQAKVALPSPYEFVGTLGRGGMGIVYHARHPEKKIDVAIKFLTSSTQDASLAKRFTREASQLSELRHPNIVGFYEAGYFQKQNYLVMEYVSGGSLRALLQEQESPLTLGQSLELFAAVADGLECIHQHGLVHRDLKPDNILLTEDRVPKIGDFGLALKLEDQSRITKSGMILGTYSYLSPEQILSKDVGPSADLYALGCCLYEAITGRPLFSGDTEFALLNSHLRQQPMPPRQIRVDIPAELDTLILRLLAKHPGERPETAAEVAKTLRKLQQSQKQVWTMPVVGRDSLLKELEQQLRPCLLRHPVAVVLKAPAGQGRSCVVRQLVTHLTRASIAVHNLVPLPYQMEPAAELFRQLGGTQEAWFQILAQGGPEAVAAHMWKLLEGLGAPRLLVVDDLLRQPPVTNAVVEAMCRQAPPPGFGWIVSCATHKAQSIPFWEGALHSELGPLDDQALRDVAQLQVSGHLDDELSEGLLFRAAGSVRRLRLWILALRGAGLLKRSGQMWTRDVSHPWPESLWEPLWLQLSARPEGEVKLLRIAGLLDDPFPYELTRELSELDENQASAALDLLLRDGLLEECWGQPGELYQFSSRELKDKLQASATDRQRRRVYAKAAQVLEGRAPQGVLADYWHRSGNDAEALPRYLQAAADCEKSGDLEKAEKYWRQTIQLASGAGNPEIRLMARVGQTQTLLRLGRYQEIDAIASPELNAALPDSAELKRTRRQLAGIVARSRWLLGQQGPDLLEFCRRELDQLADSEYSDAHWLTWCWAAYHLYQGEPAKGLEQLERLPDTTDFPPPYYWLKGSLLRSQGNLAEADRVLRQFVQSKAVCSVAEEVEILLEMALVQVQMGASPDQQGRWLDQAAGRAHQAGNLELLAEVEWYRGLFHEVQHDMGAAVRSFQRVIDASSPDSPWRIQGHLQLGVILSRMDRLEEAEVYLNEALEIDPNPLRHELNLALGVVDLLRGNWEGAREDFASAERYHGGVSARIMRCWCLLQLGEQDVAHSLAESLESCSDPLDQWLAQRLNRLRQRASEPWPTPEEQPWILQGHPLRACLHRLQPSRKVEAPLPVRPASEPTQPVSPPVPPSPRKPFPWAALLLLTVVAVAVGAALAFRPQLLKLWAQIQPQPSQSPTADIRPSLTPEASPTVVASPTVEESPTPEPTFQAPNPGTLALSVKPPNAEVRINGKRYDLVGGTVQASLPPGPYHLEVRADGFKSDERDLSLGENETLPANFALDMITGDLIVTSIPPYCQIYLDGKPVGKTFPPNSGKTFKKTGLKPGKHSLKAVREGYVSQIKPVQIPAGDQLRFQFQLEKVYVAPAPAPAPAPSYPDPPPYYDPGPAPAPAPAPPPPALPPPDEF